MTPPTPGEYGMIGISSPMLKVYSAIKRVANSRATVYIAGESGTGKELVARALHQQSARQNNPFVAVNVTEFGDDDLLEAHLFGIEKRVATGVGERDGLFMQANGGTLFLDEIAEMDKPMQAKLLRVIQEGRIVPVGGSYAKPLDTDCRVVAASSRPLEEYVKDGTFREDLYYRLRVVYITLPPLRERKEDIRLLADYFLDKYAREEGKSVQFHFSVYPWLVDQSWLGNVRELENTIRGAVAWTQKTELQPKDFLLYKLRGSDEANASSTSLTPHPHHESIEGEVLGMHTLPWNLIKSQLARQRLALHDGNISAAAKSLDINRKTFYRWLGREDMSPE